ncbi:MAG: hypothetical protein ABI221_00935 [Candidatus Saccharimonadales bacterium]
MSLIEVQAPVAIAGIEWLEDLTGRSAGNVQQDIVSLQAEANLLPEVAAESGLPLNFNSVYQLREEALLKTHRTRGLPQASFFLGKVINGSMNSSGILSKDAPTALTAPAVSHIEQRSAELAGPTGLYLRMLADSVRPYYVSRGDGYTELQPRPSHEAQITGRNQDPKAANGHNQTVFCSEADSNFVDLGFVDSQLLRPIEIDGRVVALQKMLGDHSALLIRPAVLNGVRLPVGSIMTVGQPKSDPPQFAFGRLSSFCFDTPQQAARAMPNLLSLLNDPRKRLNFPDKLTNFNNLVGRTPNLPTDYPDNQILDDAQQLQLAQEVASFTLSAVQVARQVRLRWLSNQPLQPKKLYDQLDRVGQARFGFVQQYGSSALEAADHLLLDPITQRLDQITRPNY